ncbi:MAG: C45 family peptidase [Bryobacteraceae bacterium]|jgi:hypothetical protein
MVKAALSFLLLSLSLLGGPPPELKNSFRRPEKNGWIFVHLQGQPSQIGFQHGYLLAPEIQDLLRVTRVSLTHDSGKDWAFFREAAQTVFLPHVEPQYREELQGIVDGLHARGATVDLIDVVILNAWPELSPYYTNWYDKQKPVLSAAARPVPEHCSAFVATGSYTRDGRPVIAHNNWVDYAAGSRWNIIFDIVPAAGHRLLMDGVPGAIDSGDDFGMNDAGMVITETTIGHFSGFDPAGIPEFVRARKAMQYATNIGEFAAIMKEGNNGAYANTWLVADMRANEIGSLELGLKHVTLQRAKDGYFAGSNFPANPDLIRDETDFPSADKRISENARHARWDQLMAENKGRIDLASAQRFLADHYDTVDNVTAPSERTLCGHIDLSARGSSPWQPAWGPAGAVQNKATDATLALRMSLTAAMGHACGLDFRASEHLREHPQFAWQQEILRDLAAHPWTTFSIAR